jgi:hypothetical protein
MLRSPATSPAVVNSMRGIITENTDTISKAFVMQFVPE